jgi:glutaminyl-tRNA synthetase
LATDGTNTDGKAEETPGAGAANEKEDERPLDFIRAIIADDVEHGKHGGKVVTRFPPEPNGYLHIGHAKAICLNFGVAAEHGGRCHLRFDDTNPTKENVEFVEAIQRDIRWLGWDWGKHLYFASDYFGALYEYGTELIRRGKAYVCDLSADEIREYRGTLTEPGRDSPYRTRSAEESLDLFERMRAGEFAEGARVLRGRIDMASGNINMRDPVFYRIQNTPHYRTGSAWHIYPTYDFAHCLSDAIEGITHSLCSLEFEDHRPLYDWILDQLDVPCHPQQIEFAKLDISESALSYGKRNLRRLVEGGHVRGWDDPRMPTLAGMRRRGYTPEAIRSFCDGIGVAKRASVIEQARLEFSVREDLNRRAARVLAVLQPLRVVIENYPEGHVEELEAVNNPEDPSMGTRKLPFSRTLYIERDDFHETPPPKYFRLGPGREVRLRYGYFIRCTDVVKDASGQIVEIRCSHDPATRGGNAPDGRKVQGTIHWVSAEHSLPAQVRLYEPLVRPDAPEDAEFLERLNPASLQTLPDCRVEPSLASAAAGTAFQFERVGYFSVDPDSTAKSLVFNRTVTLRDTWARIARKDPSGPARGRSR